MKFDMKTFLRISLLTLLTPLSALNAQADVNMKNAGYYKTWIDLEIIKDQRVFQLRRTYNSRSLHQGLFGFGWCSDLEKSIDLSRSDQISLKDCRLTAPIRFKKKKENLYEDDTDSLEKETLEFKDNHYLRTTVKKTQQKYNKLGKLVSLIDSTQNRLDLTYDSSDFIKAILINKHSELKVKPDPLRRHIQAIISSERRGAFYRYEGKNLVQVKNSWKNIFNYTYDELHNLTQIRYPDKTQDVLTYDKEKDWISNIHNRNKCLEVFKFINQRATQSYISTAEKRCDGKIITKTSYEFRHKARADGSKYLDQVKVTQGNKVQRVSYQNNTGSTNESQ